MVHQAYQQVDGLAVGSLYGTGVTEEIELAKIEVGLVDETGDRAQQLHERVVAGHAAQLDALHDTHEVVVDKVSVDVVDGRLDSSLVGHHVVDLT